MTKRAILVRGIVALTVLGVLAGAMATSSGAAAGLTKQKAKKIATKVSNNVFNQNIDDYASRVASSLTESPTSGLVATTTITAPSAGYLVLHGIAGLDIGTGTNDFGSCLLELNGSDVNGSEYPFALDDTESERETCVTHSVVQVGAGTYKVDLYESGLAGTSDIDDARVTALYVPLGATGSRP